MNCALSIRSRPRRGFCSKVRRLPVSSRLFNACLAALLAAAPLAPAPALSQVGPSPAAAPAADLSADEVKALVDAVAAAPDQGFGPDDFGLGRAQAQLNSSDPAARAAGQSQLIAAAIAYARAQHGGRIPEGGFPDNWALRPAPYDAQAAFAAARQQHRLAAWAASLAPADARYAALAAAYAHYRQIAAQGGWPVLPANAQLKPGAKGEAVAALRKRLAIEDPATPPGPASAKADVLDQGLGQALSRAQARYGLTPDGTLGAATVQALNTPVEQRLAQLRANLERWRWLPASLPGKRIELNSAAAELTLYDANQPALEMKAIVGRPTKTTPMFSDEVRAIVLNPPWNVPADIASREIWPKIHRDPGYARREGYVVKPGGGLQQRPGPKCALGTIKFDLSNSFGVYLHDTPSHSLFAKDDRALSHGCMRLEQPNALAKRLLKDDPNWPELRVDTAILSGSTQRIPLDHPTPVFVIYWSAFVDDQGQVNFRPDPYGWDGKLLGLLPGSASAAHS
jgi:murein L,D-transpeptidase YcbB/YkuD